MSVLLLLAAQASAAPFAQAPLPDPVLAEHRGGVRLPNGIEANWSIDTRTAVNGAVVLQTIVRIDGGPPQVAAFAPAAGETVALPGQAPPSVAGGQPTVSYDRQTGLLVTSAANPATFTVTGGSSQAGPIAGLRPVDPRASAATDAGIVGLAGAAGERGVTLTASDIQITHLTGNALGSVIVNSGSDRVIDTQTTLAIDLSNAGPDVLGSAMFRVENVTVDALAGRF